MEADVLVGAALIEVASASAGAASAFPQGQRDIAADRMPMDAWISSDVSVRRVNSATFAERAKAGVRC